MINILNISTITEYVCSVLLQFFLGDNYLNSTFVKKKHSL